MPTFVLIPGNSLNGHIFDLLLPLLPEGPKHILELTGHATDVDPSLAPLNQYGIPAQADRLAQFLEDNDLTDVVLIGVSFGGHVCHQALPKISHRIRVLISMGAPPLSLPPDMMGFRPREEFPLFFKPELTEEEAISLGEAISTRHAPMIAEMVRAVPPAFRQAANEVVANLLWKDEVEILKARPCPVVFMLALHDPLVSSAWIRDKAESLGYPFIGIESYSHVPMLDDPDLFAGAVLEAMGMDSVGVDGNRP